MKASLALALLLKPSSRQQTKITVPEGFRVAQIIALLGQETGNLKGYEQAIAHPADLGLPAFANGKPEGYLFPATYAIQPKTPPAAVLKGMVTQFKAERAEHRAAGRRGAAARRSQAAVITVASLIEAEGKRAGLRQDRRSDLQPAQHAQMKLQLDTTVLYAMSLAHREQVQHSTSRRRTTPTRTRACRPGPINNPGNTAIQAALHPDHGSYLFFLTINSKTGKTLFFTNATAFNAAVAKYGSTGGGTGSRTGSG